MAALLAVSVLPGCVRVPEDGPPVPVHGQRIEAGEPVVPDVNAGIPEPQRGSTPEETVTTYLNATRVTKNRDVLGKVFVAPQAREAYNQTGVDIVDDVDVDTVPLGVDEDSAKLRLTGRVVGAVSEDGIFTPASRSLDLTVRLVRSAQGWLFDQKPPGVLVRNDDFGVAFNAARVYFPRVGGDGGDAGGASAIPEERFLIPEERFLDASIRAAARATPIVRMLLRGPSPWLRSVSRTLLPPNTTLQGQVTFEGSDVTVELSPEAESAPASHLNAFAAQVAWSLRGYFDGRVRLLVNGRPIAVSGVEPAQGQATWGRYNPHAMSTSMPLYLLERGKLRRFGGVPAVGVNEELATNPVLRDGVLAAAVSVDGSMIAVVKKHPDGGQRLFTGDPRSTLEPVLPGTRISRPSWGSGSLSALVAVDGWLMRVGRGREPARVLVSGVTGPVREVRLALDGVRVALVIGDGPKARAYVGVLTQQAPSGTWGVQSLRLLPAELRVVQDVGWYDPVTLAVAGHTATGDARVVLAAVSGPKLQPPPAPEVRGPVVRLAAGPTLTPQPLFIGVDGQVLQLFARRWSPPAGVVSGSGSMPLYPG